MDTRRSIDIRPRGQASAILFAKYLLLATARIRCSRSSTVRANCRGQSGKARRRALRDAGAAALRTAMSPAPYTVDDHRDQPRSTEKARQNPRPRSPPARPWLAPMAGSDRRRGGGDAAPGFLVQSGRTWGIDRRGPASLPIARQPSLSPPSWTIAHQVGDLIAVFLSALRCGERKVHPSIHPDASLGGGMRESRG